MPLTPIDKALDVMIAYTQGRRIIYRNNSSDPDKWRETTTPNWDWKNMEYKILAVDAPPIDILEVLKKLEVMQAFKAGRKVEVKEKCTDNWQLAVHPMWDWQHYDYRISEEFDAKAILKRMRDCSAMWEETARLYGNILAGDIVKAIDEVLK